MLRDEARARLHVYMSTTGLGLREIASRMGYSVASLRQFSSQQRYGDGDRTAKLVLAYIEDDKSIIPELPERLYETEATRAMDKMVALARRGRWGTCYGPAGAQKTFLFAYRAAEASRAAEPSLVYIRSSASGMSPTVLLRRIAAGVGAPYAQYADGIRKSVLYTLRRRKAPVAIVLDEAQHLYKFVDTLETLREIGDLAGVRAGIIVAGNEQVLDLFSPRRGVYFEQWRSRIEQKKIRVLGPSREESRAIIAGEIGSVKKEAARIILDECDAQDPLSRKHYINARRLFHTLRDIQEGRASSHAAKVC